MSEAAKVRAETDTAASSTLRAGEVLEISGPQLSSGQVWKSANACVASVLQTGKIIGNGPGETELWIEEGRQTVRKMRCIVQDGKRLFPTLYNRYNGVPGPAGRLIPLVQEYIPEDSKLRKEPLLAEERTVAAFIFMYAAAREQGVWLLATQGYRTVEHQQQAIRRAMETESEERVMSRFAPPGFSEHHSGLALDVRGGVFQNGEPRRNDKAAWKWLAKHCHEFGFMIKNLPGKENITGTIYEPWHIRYLGNLELCRYLHENRLTLDEYLDQHGMDSAWEGSLVLDKGGFIDLDGKQYWLSIKEGRILKGRFVSFHGRQYYLSPKDGHVYKGCFARIRGRRYYLSPDDGHMLKDCWVTVDGKKYGLSETGEVFSEAAESEIDSTK